MIMESGKVVGNKVDKKIKLEVKWRYDQQLNPGFKRLMMLLLEPREKRRVNRDEKRNPQ